MADGVIQYILRMKDEASGGMKDVVVSAGEMKGHLDKAGGAASTFEDKVDAAGRVGVKFRGLLSSISLELAAFAGGIDDGADAIEGMMGSAALLNPVTLAVAAAIGIATANVAAWTAEQEREAEAADRARAANEKLVPVYDSIAEAQRRIAVAAGQMSETMADVQRMQMESLRSLQADTADATKRQSELRREMDGVGATARDAGKAFLTFIDPIGFGTAKIAEAIDGTAEMQAEYDQLGGIIKERVAATKAQVAITEIAIGTEKQATDIVKKHAATEKALGEETKKAAEEKRKAEAKNLADTRDAYAKWREDQKLASDAALFRYKEERKAVMALAEEQRRAANAAVNSAAGAVGMVAGGSSAVMGAVSSAGPWGALIAAIVSALEQGIGNIGDDFSTMHQNVMEGIGNLPNDLEENLPAWIEDGTRAALTAIPKLLVGLVKMILSVDFWVSIVMAFVDAITEALREIFGGGENKSGGLFNSGVGDMNTASTKGGLFGTGFLNMSGGKGSGGLFDTGFLDLNAGSNKGGLFGTGFLDMAPVPKYATGGYVDRTQLALVHQGEYVTPASGAGAQSAGSSGGGGGGRAGVSSQGGDVVLRIPWSDFMRAGNAQMGRGFTWRGQ